MYVWTRKEIAEAFGVAPATPAVWIREWGPETDHPFPEPIARLHKLPQPSGRPQLVFDPGAVQVWFADLREAQHRKMSKAQTGVKRPRKGAQPASLSASIQELEDSTALLVATLKELQAKRLGAYRG